MLISTDNIQLWAGFRGGGLADVGKVQLWLVLFSGGEPTKGEQLREKQEKREWALDEMRRRHQRVWHEEYVGMK